ncbi:hypothetical protein M8J77_025382 [Diaphorina citri]|nr:hypothetical protein M8J77_025382 [Diaphorina citri]
MYLTHLLKTSPCREGYCSLSIAIIFIQCSSDLSTQVHFVGGIPNLQSESSGNLQVETVSDRRKMVIRFSEELEINNDDIFNLQMSKYLNVNGRAAEETERNAHIETIDHHLDFIDTQLMNLQL